jgi:hypothetical protein
MFSGFAFGEICTIRSGDDTQSLAKVDNITKGLTIISTDHSEIHEGDFFFIKTYVIAPNDTPIYFTFTTPNDSKLIHARAELKANTEFEVNIYEGPTISATGTPIAGINANRNSLNNATLLAFAAPTVTETGTLIWSAKVGAGRSSGVLAGLNYEILAKKNTKYLFRIVRVVDLAGLADYLDVDFSWYEH